MAGRDAFVTSSEQSESHNIYIDDWLDVQLYTEDREEHPYDKMYVGLTVHSISASMLETQSACPLTSSVLLVKSILNMTP